MGKIISWKECKKIYIKNIEYDKEKIKTILEFVESKEEIIKNIKITEKNASVLTVDYYDIIKELMIALLIKNKLKSNNHECLVSFFKEKFPNKEYEVNLLYNIKKIRNKVSYEGERVKSEFLERNLLEIKNIILSLKEKL